MSPARLIATFFGIGLLRPAPGTWGSAAAIPPAYLLHAMLGFPGFLLATLAVFLIGWRATSAATRGKADHDPSEIVIDEVAGQWVALLPVSAGLWHAGVDPWLFPWPGWVTAFLMFRMFDIWKPGPVGRADRLHTPLGVMLDDIVAGVMAGIVVMLAAGFAHGVLGL